MLINLLTGQISQDEYLRMNNATILYKKLPKRVNGLIFKHHDTNIIVINEKLSEEKTKETILHEFAHMELDQLDDLKQNNDIPKEILEFYIESTEDIADEYIEAIKKEIRLAKNISPTSLYNYIITKNW